MKVSFLLGTFDPIHVGHLRMVTYAINTRNVDKVIIVPTKHNPWKKHDPLPFDVRIDLIKHSIEPFGNKCDVSDIERDIKGEAYSYKSLTELRKIYKGDDLFILCGTDVSDAMNKWKHYDDMIMPYFGKIVVPRTSIEASTDIRLMARERKCLYPFVTAYVANEIKKNGFYQETKE